MVARYTQEDQPQPHSNSHIYCQIRRWQRPELRPRRIVDFVSDPPDYVALIRSIPRKGIPISPLCSPSRKHKRVRRSASFQTLQDLLATLTREQREQQEREAHTRREAERLILAEAQARQQTLEVERERLVAALQQRRAEETPAALRLIQAPSLDGAQPTPTTYHRSQERGLQCSSGAQDRAR